MGNALAELRKKKGVTQKNVSESTGISMRTLNRYEHDKFIRSTDALKLLADYFGMSMDNLYNELYKQAEN